MNIKLFDIALALILVVSVLNLGLISSICIFLTYAIYGFSLVVCVSMYADVERIHQTNSDFYLKSKQTFLDVAIDIGTLIFMFVHGLYVLLTIFVVSRALFYEVSFKLSQLRKKENKL